MNRLAGRCWCSAFPRAPVGLRRVVEAAVWVLALCAPLGLASSASASAPSLRLERWRSAGAGAETVKLRCGLGSGGCSSTVTLSAAGLRGTQTATIPAGKARTVTLELDRAGQAMLARRRTLAIKLEVTLTAGGARTVVATRKLVMKPPNPVLGVTGAQVIRYARQFTSVPYVYGGNGPTTFDCSGFTSYVYAHFGYQLKRQTYYQMQQGRPVTGPLQSGDLIFWDGGGHVGIYTGNHTFISATVHRGVWIYSFQIWSQGQSYTTARRIVGRPTAGGSATVANWLPRNGGRADATP
jgi:cell wall-associated NlpC family hydrolase